VLPGSEEEATSPLTVTTDDPAVASTRSPAPSALGEFLRRSTARRDSLIVALTLVTGMTDAVGYLRLGGVFTSVMTGNMVLLGVAGGRGDGTLALHTGVAFFAYVLGGIVGAKIAGGPRPDGKLWPRSFTIALGVELAIFAAFTVGWELTGGKPPGNDTLVLLAVNATALGIQSAAVLRLGVSGLSTTYLTGTLTTVIAGLHRAKPLEGSGRSILVLGALIIGALVGALVTLYAPRAFPALQLGVLAVVIGGGAGAFWRRESGAAVTADEAG
jgi:uncharacterized membrane protein YoaK (UPF0700 family)